MRYSWLILFPWRRYGAVEDADHATRFRSPIFTQYSFKLFFSFHFHFHFHLKNKTALVSGYHQATGTPGMLTSHRPNVHSCARNEGERARERKEVSYAKYSCYLADVMWCTLSKQINAVQRGVIMTIRITNESPTGWIFINRKTVINGNKLGWHRAKNTQFSVICWQTMMICIVI